jgi:hypothetical protein
MGRPCNTYENLINVYKMLRGKFLKLRNRFEAWDFTIGYSTMECSETGYETAE